VNDKDCLLGEKKAKRGAEHPRTPNQTQPVKQTSHFITSNINNHTNDIIKRIHLPIARTHQTSSSFHDLKRLEVKKRRSSTTLAMASGESVTDRLCSNDPTLLKLHLVQEPSKYFTRPEEEEDEQKSNGNADDDVNSTSAAAGADDDNVKTKVGKKKMISFRAFLEALQSNTSVTFVYMERRFVRHLSRAEYANVLYAIGRMPNVRQVEIWCATVPLSTLCTALGQSCRLDRLGLGMVTLVETDDCHGLAHRATLQTFYLSDFRFLENDQDDASNNNNNNKSSNNLDSLLQALGTCPKLGMVEIVNHQNDSSENNHTDWSSPRALAALVTSSTSLVHLTLRRVGLQAAHATALAGAIDSATAEQRPLRRLRVLHLDENHLGNAGSIAIVQAVVNGGVKDLSLRNNQIDATGCVAIADALMLALQAQQEGVASSSGADDEESCWLEKLNLAMNPIEDRGGSALARLLLHQHNQQLGLKQLELSRANMTDVGCCALAHAVRENTTLLVLGLSFNRMKDATYLAFAASLKVNRTLQSINLVSERSFIACLSQSSSPTSSHFSFSCCCRAAN
jgi:Leucine Rich repeat